MSVGFVWLYVILLPSTKKLSQILHTFRYVIIHRCFKNAAANVAPVAPTSVVLAAAILMLFVAVYYNVQRRDYFSWDYLISYFKEELRFCSQVIRARTCA